MADLPTWMELRGMFLSLKSIDPVRLDWSLNTPTEAGRQAGNVKFETWRLAQGTKHDKHEIEAVSRLAGRKLFSILNPLLQDPLPTAPLGLEEFWYGMACKPPKDMTGYLIGWGLSGDIRTETIESAVLFDAPSHFATKCLEFLEMFGEGPSPIAEAVPTVDSGVHEQPTGELITWEKLGGARFDSWGELAIEFDSANPSQLKFQVRNSTISISFKQLGLTKKRSIDDKRSVLGDYLKTVIENSSSIARNGKRGAVKATRERLNRILGRFFGLGGHAIDPMNRPLFNPRDMRFIRPVRKAG